MYSIYFFFCLLALVSCRIFHPNQHLPVQYQPPLRYQSPHQQPYNGYYPYYIQSGKIGGTSDVLSNKELNDIDRQFNQHWQIAIPSQQQGGVVWISAPQYGYNPQPEYPYPPSPGQPAGQNPGRPSSPSSTNPTGPNPAVHPGAPKPAGPSPHPSPPADQLTISRDTIVPSSGSGLESTSTAVDSTIILAINETPASSNPSSTFTFTTESSSSMTEPSGGGSTSSSPTNENTPTSTTKSNSSSSGTSPKPANTTNPLLRYCKEPKGQFLSSDCSKFINCWDDIAFEQSCPDGLLFNAEKKWCDSPENVDCGNATRPGSNFTTNSTTSGNADCPESYGTHKNKTNCAAFYVCVFYEPIHFDCAPGTAYNDELQVCDYPYRVDCKGAPLPESHNNTITVPSETFTNSSIPANSSSSFTTPKPVSSSENSNSSSTYSVTETISSSSSSSTQQSSSIIPPSPISGGGSEVVATSDSNFKKLPESIVKTGVRCYHTNIYRVTPDCSSVTMCQNGLTYIVNCGQSSSYDAYSESCVPTFRARC